MKLYKIKIESESYRLAETEENALIEFWESKNDIETNVDNFINDITEVEEITEAQDLLVVQNE